MNDILNHWNKVVESNKFEIERLQSITDDSLKKTKEYRDQIYTASTVNKLIELALSVNQFEVPEGMVCCKKVIRIKKFNISDGRFKCNHPEAINYSGTYIIAEGLAIPPNIMKEIGFYNKRGYLKLDSLPDGYCYGTLRDVGKYGFALKYSEVTDIINGRSSAWNFFDISI